MDIDQSISLLQSQVNFERCVGATDYTIFHTVLAEICLFALLEDIDHTC
jgi:hypothetical protein